MKSIRLKSCKYDYLRGCHAFLFLWTMAITVNAGSMIGVAANDLTMCEYNKDTTLSVRVHANRMFVDYDHLGFFRIGVLPKLVFENVQIEVQSVETLTNALANLQTLGASTTIRQRLELKNIEIKLIGETHSQLSAATAHALKDNTIELSGISLHHPSAQPTYIAKALLHLTGSSAGKLFWNSDGNTKEAFAFSSQINKTP